MHPLETLVPKIAGKFNSSLNLLYKTSQDWMETGSDWFKRSLIQGRVSEYILYLKKAAGDVDFGHGTVILVGSVVVLLVLVYISQCIKDRRKLPMDNVPEIQSSAKNQNIHFDVFDLAKTSYERGHTEAVIRQTDEQLYDVNFKMPTTGLSLFLCACISGHYRLIRYMLKKGGDTSCTTVQGDSPLYLATYGVLSSPLPDLSVLEELIHAGCDINTANDAGYTPLHQAASHGNQYVVKYLLMKGADPYAETVSGILPIDSAVNAGHIDVAELLAVDIANPHVWDIVDPHTPTRISQGLLSPRRKLMMESPLPKKKSAILQRHV